jgi:hypothetical protein
MTFTTIETGETHITAAAKLFTNGVRGEDSRRESGSVVATAHAITNGIVSRDAKKANGGRKMGGVVGNLESGNATTFGYPFNMPEKVKLISSAGHSTTIHMSMGRGVGVKEQFSLSELLVDMRARCFHRTNAKIKGMKSTGSRVKGISEDSDEVHLGRICRETGRVDTAKEMRIRRKLVMVIRRGIIGEGREIVIIIVVRIREGEAVRRNKTASLPVTVFSCIQVEVGRVKEINLRRVWVRRAWDHWRKTVVGNPLHIQVLSRIHF